MAEELDPMEDPGSAVDALVDEYLDGMGRGRPPAIEDLERRAGRDAAELRERLRLMERLNGLSALIADPPSRADDLDRVGQYQMLGDLGQGGLSRVYLAEDTQLGRKVAFKVLDQRGPGSPDGSLWIPEEAKILASVQHDGVVHVFDADEDSGVSYMVMELVRGPTLEALIETLRSTETVQDAADPAPPLTRAARNFHGIADRCRLVQHLARALQACHEAGVIHRDVKPANVLLDHDRVPKLIDFGLARGGDDRAGEQTRKGDYGSRAFLAPELHGRGNHDATAASDQYSLGVLFYQLLTLELPRPAGAGGVRPPRELRREIPVDVERICMHCMERDPDRRYPSLAALAEDIEAYLGYRAISIEEPGPLRRAWLAARRRPALATVSTMTLVLLGSATVLASWRIAGHRRALSDLEAGLSSAIEGGNAKLDLAFFFNDVERAREAGRRYELPVLTGLLLGDTGARIDGLWAEASHLLHAMSAKDFETASSKKTPRQTDVTFAGLLGDAEWTLRFESLSSGTGRCTQPHHRLGTVDLPRGTRLVRFDPASETPAFPLFAPADTQTRLLDGYYRASGEAAWGRWEFEFLVWHTPHDGHWLRPRRAPRFSSASCPSVAPVS